MPDRVAVITGASSGIGEVFARRLAQDGYGLLLVARRRDRLDALAAELGGQAFEADLTDEASLHALEIRLRSDARISLLVNNAGFGLKGRFFQASVDDHERMHKLHVIATMRLTHAALSQFVPRDSGAIINVSSVAGFTTSPGGTSYAATKAWMNSFTEGLHLDLQSRGSHVRVQALCPGFTYSEFHDTMGMDRGGIPKSWWTTAEYVVDASLRGLETGKLFVIPGWRYRMLVGVQRFLPAELRRSASIHFARKYKKQQ